MILLFALFSNPTSYLKAHCINVFKVYFLEQGLIIKEHSLRKKCSYSELFWSAFSRIQTEYAEIRSISPYSVQMRENADQNNSEYGHFSRCDSVNVVLNINPIFLSKHYYIINNKIYSLDKICQISFGASTYNLS